MNIPCTKYPGFAVVFHQHMRRISVMLLFLAGLDSLPANAQIILFNPMGQTTTVCQDQTMSIQMVHTGTEHIGVARVTLELPCGFEYLVNTIDGLLEEDVSDLQRPVFRITDWTPGEDIPVQWQTAVTCAASACLNAGNLFLIKASLTYEGTEQAFQSDAFNVLTPQLVIVGAKDQVMTGASGQTLTRTYTIRNTRFGRLASFLFEDAFEEGILVQSSQGTDEGSTSERIRRRIGGMEFQTIGNKDQWLDFGEEFTITETISILACPQEVNKAGSTIRVSWGCHAATCQSPEYPSVVLISAGGSPGPAHEIQSVLEIPACKSDTAVLQTLLLRDTSQYHDLLNVQLTLDCRGPALYFVPGSISATVNGETYFPSDSSITDTPCGKSAIKTLRFEFPLIKAGEEVLIRWEQYFCKTEACLVSINDLEWQLFYEKSCAAFNDRLFTSRNKIQTSLPDTYLAGAMSFPQEDLPLLTDNTPFAFKISASSENLLKNDHTLLLRINLPCGVQITDTTLLIEGKAPTFKSIPSTQGPAEILLEYTTPFSTDQVFLLLTAFFTCDTSCMDTPCEEVLITTCPQNCPFSGNSVIIKSEISITDDRQCDTEGLDNICLDLKAGMQCFTDVCIDTLAGYIDFHSSLERISLGLPDNDNDSRPDTQGELNIALLRLDRIIPGDSIRIASSGRIITDGRDTTFDHLVFTYSPMRTDQFQIPANRAQSETARMIHPDSGFVNYRNTLTIRPAGSNSSFSAMVTGSFDPLTEKYIVDINLPSIKAANPAFPQDYRFGNLDSVSLATFFLLAHNPSSYNPFANNSITLDFKIDAHLFSGSELPDEDRSNCVCQNVQVEVGNLNYIIGRNAREFGLCQDTIANYDLFLSLGCLSNFFPFEYRTTFDKLDPLFLPAVHYTIAKARIATILVNGAVMAANIPIDIPSLTGGGYHFELDSIARAFKEENTVIFLQFDLVSTACQRAQGNQAPLLARTELAPYHLRRPKRNLTVTNNMLLTWQWTNMQPDIAICNQTYFNNQAIWELQITNCHGNPLGLTDIPNLYLRIGHSSNALTDATVTRMDNGQTFSLEQGSIQLGTLARCDTLLLELRGINRSCSPEDIRLWLGWGCDPDDPFTEPCTEREFHCSFFTPPGLLELAVDTVAQSGVLCDSMPQTRVLYLNADLGAAYRTRTEIQLPSGLHYVPGSALIRWPQQSGPFTAIPDPVMLPGNRLVWELYDLLPTSDSGLPGVLSDPENGLELIFQTLTTCDFISGSRIIVTYDGEQVCQRPTNQLAQVSGPYHIQGAETPYATQIGVTTASQSACSDLISVAIQVITEAIEGSHDKLELALPPGFLLLPDSTQTNLASPIPLWDSGRWYWPLQPDLPVTFLHLVLQVDDSVACAPSILSMFTSLPVEAYCASEDTLCTISVMTGSRFLPLQLSRRSYEIRDMQVGFQQGSHGIRAEIVQTGGPFPGTGTGELYLDLDGDGQLSPGDELLMTQSFAIGADSSATLLFFPINLPRERWCQVILVLDQDKNCLCIPVTGQLPKPIRIPFFETLEICWLGEVSLGPAPQPGVSYQWQGDHLSCNDCAMTEFAFANPGTLPVFHTLVLQETWPGGCALDLEYHLQIEPKPGIIPPLQTICPGETATLTATGGNSFLWTGPDLLDNSAQIVFATPGSSATYILHAEDALGCLATDTAFVHVIEFPANPAGPDRWFCLGAEAELQATQVTGYGYHWVNGQGRLDDPFRPDPQITMPESYVFILEISFGLCRQYDSVAVTFASTSFPGILPDTIEACAGDTLRLNLPETHSYTWQPNFTGLCQNPACSEVAIPILLPQEFLIEATDSMGCLSAHTLSIKPKQDTARTQYEVSVCAGGQFVLGPDTISLPGNYCDTTVSSSGCIRINCYALTFAPIPKITFSDSFCAGGFYLHGGDTLVQAGIYCDTIRQPDGCLEEYCLELSERPAEPDSVFAVLCPGDLLVFQGDTLDMAGTYCVTLQGHDLCDSVVCLVLLQDSLPVILLPFLDSLICAGDTIWLFPEILPSDAEFQWQDGFPELDRPIVTAGSYLLTIRDSCDQAVSALLTIRDPDTLILSIGPDTTLCEGDSLLVSPQVIGGDYTWSWLDGHPEWERVIDRGGLYILQLTDRCGNDYLDSLNLTVTACVPCSVDIPNLFTPNQDGTNDVFRLITDCALPDARMRIYNRWGQVVYDGHPVQPGWNGEFRGKAQPMEVYAYVIEYDDPWEGARVLRGDVTLLR